jgi:hypothetical protein
MAALRETEAPFSFWEWEEFDGKKGGVRRLVARRELHTGTLHSYFQLVIFNNLTLT